MNSVKSIFFLLTIICYSILTSPETQASDSKEIIYLSGTDNENTVDWDFYCTGGRKNGEWTKIAVPSHWEQQGFGSYNYGRDYHTYGKDFTYADESGLYKYEFTIPESWKKKEIFIVFEGSMTDTEVKINGEVAGEKHQGSFYQFRYNITDLVNRGEKNLVEVKVDKMSSNHSVNRAERYADYWIFGGIYRPVYLEAFPEEYITRIAVDAKANGELKIETFLSDKKGKMKIVAQVFDSENNMVATANTAVLKGDSMTLVSIRIENPKLWSSEFPNCYKVKVAMHNKKGVLFETSTKFGFRTVEVKEGDGIYINGKRVVMKGINRHVWWPETGRCINKKIDLLDVQLMKEMNMNAVRCSHYPPDQSFLDICDSLGLYVIDELAGWHNAYDTQVGEKLVREMVTRDVNHPSILFWSNGNEGGHNPDLDNEYAIYDPSKRTVIHAHHKKGNTFNGIDCNHYETYSSVEKLLKDSFIYMPTEFLHAQNDGGGAAGLYDYWELLRSSPKSGGGFVWALLDEGIVRTDMNNSIDVNGVNAPDGVVGPHREKEGSFYAMKEIFSPVVFNMNEVPDDFVGKIEVENRFDFTNINQCTFQWELVKYNLPSYYETGYKVIDRGETKGSDIEPAQSGTLELTLPYEWYKADALILKTTDPYGKEVYTRTWKIKDNEKLITEILNISVGEAVKAEETDSAILVKAKDNMLVFSKKTGMLEKVVYFKGRNQEFKNGPVMCSGTQSFYEIKHYPEGDAYVVEALFDGDLKYAKWKMYKTGFVSLNYEYELHGDFNFAGISFDYPEERVISAKWLGNGPYRVWKNRKQGGNINVWQNAYNNTQTGQSPWIYPEFKGYFSDITWLELNTVDGKMLIASKEEDLFVRLFEFYSLPGVKPHPELPDGDISFLDCIPPTGSKMSTKFSSGPETSGPAGHKNKLDGIINRTLYFYFGLTEK